MEKIPEYWTNNEANKRLDVFLRENINGLSRKKAGEFCDEGLVLVNGRRERAGYQLTIGDRVVFSGEMKVPTARPELVKSKGGPKKFIKIAYEDQWLLVVEKPAGMHSVTLDADDPITLADCIAAYCSDCVRASQDIREAGLVQRLDFWTSGLVIAAKDPSIWEHLHHALVSGEVQKSYIALCDGHLKKKQVKVRTDLVPESGGKKMCASESDASIVNSVSETLIELIENKVTATGVKYSFVRAFTRHTSRHQIRVHLSHLGHPLVGDSLYGSKTVLKNVLIENARDGFYLLAESIKLTHPVTGQQLEVLSGLHAG